MLIGKADQKRLPSEDGGANVFLSQLEGTANRKTCNACLYICK